MLSLIEAQKGYLDQKGQFIDGGVTVILVDTEKKFSKERFEHMGGDSEKLLLIDADTLEEAFFALDETLKVIFSTDDDSKVLIVFDSIGGTPAMAEAGSSADETLQLAIPAKVIKRNLRVFVPKWLSNHDVAMIVINTNYANIGSVGRSNSGGDGLEFASAFIIQLSRVKDLLCTENNIRKVKGIVSRASVTKNHLQNSAVTVKSLDFEIYAYEVKLIDKFMIKRGAEFINDDGRVKIVKVNKKTNEVTYLPTFDAASNPQHGVSTILPIEELKKFLEDFNFEAIASEDDSSEDSE
jgi:RecA/RadA recombinase